MIIREFELEHTNEHNIEIGGAMPVGFSVAEYNRKLRLWVQLEEGYPGTFNVDVFTMKTEQQYEKQTIFAGTAVMSSGEVYHVFTKTHYIRNE